MAGRRCALVAQRSPSRGLPPPLLLLRRRLGLAAALTVGLRQLAQQAHVVKLSLAPATLPLLLPPLPLFLGQPLVVGGGAGPLRQCLLLMPGFLGARPLGGRGRGEGALLSALLHAAQDLLAPPLGEHPGLSLCHTRLLVLLRAAVRQLQDVGAVAVEHGGRPALGLGAREPGVVRPQVALDLAERTVLPRTGPGSRIEVFIHGRRGGGAATAGPRRHGGDFGAVLHPGRGTFKFVLASSAGTRLFLGLYRVRRSLVAAGSASARRGPTEGRSSQSGQNQGARIVSVLGRDRLRVGHEHAVVKRGKGVVPGGWVWGGFPCRRRAFGIGSKGRHR